MLGRHTYRTTVRTLYLLCRRYMQLMILQSRSSLKMQSRAYITTDSTKKNSIFKSASDASSSSYNVLRPCSFWMMWSYLNKSLAPLAFQRTIINYPPITRLRITCCNSCLASIYNYILELHSLPLEHEQSCISISSQVITCTSQHNKSNREEAISIHSH